MPFVGSAFGNFGGPAAECTGLLLDTFTGTNGTGLASHSLDLAPTSVAYRSGLGDTLELSSNTAVANAAYGYMPLYNTGETSIGATVPFKMTLVATYVLTAAEEAPITMTFNGPAGDPAMGLRMDLGQVIDATSVAAGIYVYATDVDGVPTIDDFHYEAVTDSVEHTLEAVVRASSIEFIVDGVSVHTFSGTMLDTGTYIYIGTPQHGCSINSIAICLL